MPFRIPAALCLLALVASTSARAAEKLVVARVIRCSSLKSDDGKVEVSLLTVGFNMTSTERDTLTRIMNSDGYWDHFRHHRMTLEVGDARIPSGPRLLVRPTGERPIDKILAAPDYTVTFEIPAEVKLADEKMAFIGRVEDPNVTQTPKPPPFAELKLTAKEFATLSGPLRLAILSSDEVSEEVVKGLTVKDVVGKFAVCMRALPHGDIEAVRIGKLESVAESPVMTVNGKKHHQAGDLGDFVLLFAAKPDPKAALAVRIKGHKPWFPCEAWKANDTPPAPAPLK